MDGLQKTAIGMQYKGGEPLLEWEKHRDGWCVPASFLPSLFYSLPTAMGFHNSEIKVDGRKGLLQRVKPLPLMSPVFNHHTVEWFYAYFICISLNHVSRGIQSQEKYKVGERGKKKRSLWCLSSNRDLFHDLPSTFAKIIMTWKPLKLDTTLDFSNSCRAVYF